MRLFSVLTVSLAVSAGSMQSAEAADSIKVFLMAGQSNMQGHGRLETGNASVSGGIGSLRYQVNNDPANYGHLVDANNNWATRNDVWVWSRHLTETSKATGDLGPGFGVDADRFGPELGFGNVLGDLFDDQVVLVKTAWGGKSLAVDFRPPTAVADRGGTVGTYYNLILSSYQEALVDIAGQFPGKSIELTGYGCHQGCNDRVNQTHNNEYEGNMADFIEDIRDALNAPDLPFVIATTGMSGWTETHPRALSLMNAQLAMANATKYPDFVGNVSVVETRDFYRDVNASPANQGFHWNQNGETYYLIGQGMGEAMAQLVPEPSSMALLAAAGLLTASRRRRR